MKRLATLAALAAALTFTSTTHATEQTTTVPGVGTVTVHESLVPYRVPSEFLVTIPAPDHASSIDFAPIVYVAPSETAGRGANFALRAQGTGSSVSTSAYGLTGGSRTCHWLSGPWGSQVDYITSSVSADGRSVTFVVPRSYLNMSARMRWMVVDGRPSRLGPETECTVTGRGLGEYPGDPVGVTRDLLGDPYGFEFVGEATPYDPRPAGPPMTVKPRPGGAEISWQPVPGADLYAVGVKGETGIIIPGTRRVLTGLKGGRTYTVTLTALRETGPHALESVTRESSAEFIPLPGLDPDGDGISNDWKGAPAPRKPHATKVTATSVTLALAKPPKGTRRLRVYRKAGNGEYKLVATTTKRTVKVGGAKPSTTYRFKVVAVNARGKQSAASKPIAVKTRRK